jgi:ABC-2 type transport system ATP-binding protein
LVVQCLQRWTGVNAEVLGQSAADLLIGGQRVGLATVAVETDDELLPQPLAQWVGADGVLIFDEPLNGLDPDGITWMRGLLRQLAAEGRTVFVSSHLLREVAHTVDDVVVIRHGRLAAAGRLDELSTRHNTLVRTPDPATLTTALLAAGISAHRNGSDRVDVPDVDAEVVGQLAAREGVVITALSEQHDDLGTL